MNDKNTITEKKSSLPLFHLSERAIYLPNLKDSAENG